MSHPSLLDPCCTVWFLIHFQIAEFSQTLDTQDQSHCTVTAWPGSPNQAARYCMARVTQSHCMLLHGQGHPCCIAEGFITLFSVTFWARSELLLCLRTLVLCALYGSVAYSSLTQGRKHGEGEQRAKTQNNRGHRRFHIPSGDMFHTSHTLPSSL